MQPLTRSCLQKGYFGALTALLVLLFIVGVFSTLQDIENHEAINRIDQTGRLQMLGQRVVQKAILIRNVATTSKMHADLSTAIKQFQATLLGLEDGSPELELQPTTDADTLATVALVNSQWWKLLKKILKQRSPITNDPETARLTAVGDQLLEACEQLMTIERRHLVAGNRKIFWILTSCLVGLLFLGMVTLWLWKRERQLYVAEETTRKTADLLSETRRSEARLKTMLASSHTPLLTVDARGIVETASDSVETVFGWKPQELIGKNVNVLIPEPYHSDHDRYMSEYQRTQKSNLVGKPRELSALRRDGTIVPCLVTLWQVDLPDQSEPLFMGTLSDITERKCVEADLERFRAALDCSADPIFLIDRNEMRFVDMNETACASLGYSRDELLAMGPQDIKPNISKQELAQKFDEIIASEQQMGTLETVHRRKDGSTFPVEVFLRVLETDDATILIASVRDVTERKQVEAELKSLNQQLVNSARQAGKAEIATSVLHNVGNVLNSVNVSAGLIQDKVRRSNVSRLTKATSMMEQHLHDLGTYITHDDRGKHLPRFLIEVSREMASEEEKILDEVHSLVNNIEHIKIIVTEQQSHARGVSGLIEEVSLAELLDNAIRINMASMHRHSVDVIRQYDELAPALVDKQKLLQIVVNLISNAKYSCLESGHEVKQVTVCLRSVGEDRVAVEISDNGMGIAPENLTRIFAHGFTTRKEGHGFGLHSAALTAESLEGSLAATSDGPGAGATFILELPYQTAEAPACMT